MTLKRDFSERNMGQGPAAKRRDSTGAQGRLVPSSVALNALLWVPLLYATNFWHLTTRKTFLLLKTLTVEHTQFSS